MYKIMFVDDEEQNLFLMEKILDWEEMGFRVCGFALDGMEGIKVYEEAEPDVVFVDIRMEEMDGLTLIQELKAKGRDTIYVIVTAYGEFSYAQRAIALGVKDYLLKPLSRREMIPMMQEIRNTLDKRREKEQEKQVMSRQYGNNLFAKVLDRLEISSLKGEEGEISEEVNEVIAGRILKGIRLVSPWETPVNLAGILRKWGTLYEFTGYDCAYGLIEESVEEQIIEQFEMLKAKNMRKKYFLVLSPNFIDTESLRVSYKKDFMVRNYCFYEKESQWYRSEQVTEQNKNMFTVQENRLEDAVRDLSYNASSERILTEIKNMVQEAEKQHCIPGTLTDAMIELLISIKSQLTKIYQKRAFMILRHQNLWDLHRLKTKTALFQKMEQLIIETEEAVKSILDNQESYTLSGKIMEYIHDNFSRTDFSASEAAEAVHLSRNYFLKIFKEEQGISFWDYVTQMRMEKAKKLLKTTEETVYSISKEVGYESQYHFSRKFKNLCGVSPNEYRNL